jgi:hypothetical protein
VLPHRHLAAKTAPKGFAYALAMLLFGGIASLAGCPGTLENPERFKTDGGACPDVPTVTFANKCATDGCHVTPVLAGNLDLAAAGLEARVAGVQGSCNTDLLADPANPQDSLLYTKLDSAPPCGSKMPLVGTLEESEKQCILEWIGTLTNPTTTSSSGGGMGGGGGAGGGAGGMGGAGGAGGGAGGMGGAGGAGGA